MVADTVVQSDGNDRDFASGQDGANVDVEGTRNQLPAAMMIGIVAILAILAIFVLIAYFNGPELPV